MMFYHPKKISLKVKTKIKIKMKIIIKKN